MDARQQSLFDAEPEPWELDAGELRLVASVVFPSANAAAAGPFDYLAPEQFADERRAERCVEPGRRVRVPFGRGNRLTVGYCTKVGSQRVVGRRLKEIVDVIDSRPLLSPALLQLTQWMADYYLCPWGQVLECVLPAGVRGKAGTREVTLLEISSRAANDVAQQSLSLRSPQQKKVLTAMLASREPLTAADLAKAAGCSTAPVQALVKAGVLAPRKVRIDSAQSIQNPTPRDAPPELNGDQRAAVAAVLEALESREPSGLLLHGVTGSGKTEVYLQAIERVASFGRQAIVLVPEISLTPQTVRRFRARFDKVAVLHSHLTDAERHHHWQRIARGDVQVVVGARSAVFAPTPHLGLIVIDEEHEATFKQDSAPRYHARDVAWQRAQAEKIPLVLGSATPSLETWHRATRGEFQVLSLPERVLNLPLPDVLTVNLRDSANTRYSRGAISRPLQQAMRAALVDGGQVILLLNRRGYSTHIQCPGCGYVLTCEHCDVTLTFHRQHDKALCHLCDYQAPPPRHCPECQSQGIRYSGLGTQKLEAEVKARFPEHRCERMDADAMRTRGSHANVLDAFGRGEIDVLLGTQMIAKGLDFPNVTLVGVVSADTALNWPDFRAAERTFQLVAQVAGRTGRSRKGGRVLVQTLNPEHDAIRAAVRHDYRLFADKELETRRQGGYPPFAAMARVIVRGPKEEATRETAIGLGERLRQEAAIEEAVRVLGPGVAPIARLRGEHRFQLQLTAPAAETLHAVIRAATAKWQAPSDVRWIVDVDPWDML